MPIINVTHEPLDANDGIVRKLDYMVGNRRYGQKVFLSAQEGPVETAPGHWAWHAFESLTVSTTALAMTEALVETADRVHITAEVAAVRYRVDGQAPTASVGHLLEVGDVLELEGYWELDQFRAIRRDGTDATLRVSYGARRNS